MKLVAESSSSLLELEEDVEEDELDEDPTKSS